MLLIADLVVAAASSLGLRTEWFWLRHVSTEVPGAAVICTDGGLLGTLWERCIDVLLTASWPPVVLGLFGITMAAIGIVGFIRN